MIAMNGRRPYRIAALALILLLCGCQTHVHQYRDATCTEPKTCAICGQTEGEAKGHEWTDATCTEPKTCARCGQTEGEAKGHEWTEATCTEPKTCARCGLSEGEAKGHDYTEPTCTEDGVCTRCGETIPAKGHDFSEATCMRPKTCTRCGLSEGEAKGHDMADGVCTRCGFTVYAPVTGKGDAVLTDVDTGTGVCRVHMIYRSGGGFTVWAYDADGRAELLTYANGAYDGSALLTGSAPYTIEISASGNWEITVEQLDAADGHAFAGTGDAVTDLMLGGAGTYRFVHSGKEDFVVWLYTADGETLLVQALGACETEQTVAVPQGGFAFFAVRADGAWTIEPAETDGLH